MIGRPVQDDPTETYHIRLGRNLMRRAGHAAGLRHISRSDLIALAVSEVVEAIESGARLSDMAQNRAT